jgi:di/tricarboxylate transporter
VPWDAWFTVGVVAVVFVAMVRAWLAPDMTLLLGAVTLAVFNVIDAEDFAAGFGNPGMLTIAALYVVAAAMRETGALDSLGRIMLPQGHTPARTLGRLCPQVSLLSAFLNNTAVVAMLLPIVGDWCRRNRISPSKILLPLSYAAVLGGTCTLIGTSTNLIVNGMMIARQDDGVTSSAIAEQLYDIGFFEVAWVGVPAVIVGLLYLLLIGRHFLPENPDLLEDINKAAREYLVNMRVQPGSPLEFKRVKDAGLRHLPGLFLIEIVRDDRVLAPVTPNDILRGGDRLTFTGQRSTIVDLERIPGLERIDPHEEETLAQQSGDRYYTEAVVSRTSPLIGRNIRDSNFRALYNAVVVAVHRGGHHLTGRVGDIVLQAGDTLLLQTGPNFMAAHSNSPDFFLISRVREGRPVRRERAWASLAYLAILVALMASGIVDTVVAAILVAGLMVVTRCISIGDARRGIQWNVLLAIASALAIGNALASTGAAGTLGHLVISATQGLGPIAALAAVYIIAVIFTELLTNSAAAALVFPLAISVADELGVNARPFAMAVVFGASFGFATPIGYQTNLMVYGPGGYRFMDFLKTGILLNIILCVLVVFLLPQIWPLS